MKTVGVAVAMLILVGWSVSNAPSASAGPLDDSCSTGSGSASAISPVISNGAGSEYRVYVQFLEGKTYVSWTMSTNTMQNGADIWGFNIQIDDHVDDPHSGFPIETPYTMLSDDQHGICKEVGAYSGRGLDWLTDSGAIGWVGTAECSFTVSWSLSVGATISMTGGGASATFSYGESSTCGQSQTVDSESLLGGTGQCGGTGGCGPMVDVPDIRMPPLPLP